MLLINTQTLCWCLLDWCPCAHVIMVIKQHRMRVKGEIEAYSQLFTQSHLHLFKEGVRWPVGEIFTLDGAPSLMILLINLFFLRNWVSDWHHRAGLLNLVCVVCTFSKIRSVCGQCDMTSCGLLLWRTSMITYSSSFLWTHISEWGCQHIDICMSARIPPSDGNIYKYVPLAFKCVYSIFCIAAFLLWITEWSLMYYYEAQNNLQPHWKC